MLAGSGGRAAKASKLRCLGMRFNALDTSKANVASSKAAAVKAATTARSPVTAAPV